MRSSVSRKPAPTTSTSPSAAASDRTFSICKLPSDADALHNRVFVHPPDWGTAHALTINGTFTFGLVADARVQSGTLGLSAAGRKWAQLSLVDSVLARPTVLGAWLQDSVLDLSFVSRSQPENDPPFDVDAISALFRKAYDGLPLCPGQSVIFDFRGVNILAKVKVITTVSASGDVVENSADIRHSGMIMDTSHFTFARDQGSNIRLQASSTKAAANAVVAPNFNFNDLGIGGLDTEFAAIFRRAFASRVFPPGLIQKLGIQHVKGILLHGPPGTGKTLMARQIGKMLNAHEPNIVNGPEILSKFVGASEENIRKLFADAEKEYKLKGDESELHIIIMDELDAICKQRGSGTTGGTGVGDTVVNQLLSKMDGVDQLNNILIIGMTNRKDMIDDALLRPGRLEVHMEIALPDEAGRLQIINIHTAKMRGNGIMDSDVDLLELAEKTKNFSGAEIGGLVKSATSWAMNRHIKGGTTATLENNLETMKVNRADFMHGLAEVPPAFGVSEEELDAVVENGIFHFNSKIEDILRDGKLLVDQVRLSDRTPLVSVLLHGPAGSGKSALAATIAKSSEFPFIKLISPDSMVGLSDSAKVSALNKVFMDSYKSPLSIIVMDQFERLLEWTPLGLHWNNSVFQALLVLLGKRPPKGKRLLILATCRDRRMLKELGASEYFTSDILVPAVTTFSALRKILRAISLFDGELAEKRAWQLLESAGFGQEGMINIGVKRILNMAEMARQDPNPDQAFLMQMQKEQENAI